MASGAIKKRLKIYEKAINSSTDAGGNLNTGLSYGAYMPISFVPDGVATTLKYWYFAQYSSLIYLTFNVSSTNIKGTLYYIDLLDI